MQILNVIAFFIFLNPQPLDKRRGSGNLELDQSQETTFILTRTQNDIAYNEYTGNLLALWRTDPLTRRDLYEILLKNKDSFNDFDHELLIVALGEPDYSIFGYKYESFYEIDSSRNEQYFGCWIEFHFSEDGLVNNLTNPCH